MKVFSAPEQILVDKSKKSVFLAGTIDNGKSLNWQKDVINQFETLGVDVNIYNPRREDWKATIKQSFDDPKFYQQVNWELDALTKADLIIMNFLPDSKSPVSLLELGLFATSGKFLVVCPDEFYRSGNVNIVCSKFSIPVYKNMEDLIKNHVNVQK